MYLGLIDGRDLEDGGWRRRHTEISPGNSRDRIGQSSFREQHVVLGS